MTPYDCPFPGCTDSFSQRSALSRHRNTIHRGKRLPSVSNTLTLEQRIWWDRQVDRGREWTFDGIEAEEEDEDDVGAVEPEQSTRNHQAKPFPSAAWACDREGEYLPEQCPPPLHPAELLVDPADPYYPFTSESEYRWSKFCLDKRLSGRDVKDLLDAVEEEIGHRPFSDKRAMMEVIDRIPYGGKWRKWEKVTSKVGREDLGIALDQPGFEFLDEEHTLYIRNTHLVLLHLLSSIKFRGHQNLIPTQVTDENGKPVVSEPYTGSKAWDFQESLDNARHCGVRIDAAQDSTLCSSGTGGASEHPVYLHTAINAGATKRGEMGGMAVVAFLPAFKRSTKGNDEYYRRYKRIMRHKAMHLIFEPLRNFIKQGELVQYADGHFRHSKGYLGPNAVDHPESCWLNCVFENWTVCCDRNPKEMHRGPGNPRDMDESEAIRKRAREEPTLARSIQYAAQYGLHLESPFYASFGVNGFELCVADILHQLTKGSYKDFCLDKLVIPYLQIITDGGKRNSAIMNRLAFHLRCMPPFPRQRRFKGGIEFSQWTGRDTEHLMRILPTALYDLSGQDRDGRSQTAADLIPQMMAYLAILYQLATSYESTAEDREMQDVVYKLLLEIVNDPELFDFQEESSSRRLHKISHFSEWTLKWGTAPHSNTSFGETAHKKAVKDPYRDSNKCFPTEQILRSNGRRDGVRAFEEALAVANEEEYVWTPPIPEYFEAEAVMGARGTANSRRRISIIDISHQRELPGLPLLLDQYLKSAFGRQHSLATDAYVYNTIKTFFPVYREPAVLDPDLYATESHVIYASLNYNHRSSRIQAPRFDPILIRDPTQLDQHHYKGYSIARARLFFSIMVHGKRLDLALVDMYEIISRQFQPVKQPLVQVQRDPLTGNKLQQVIPVSQIVRSVHLQPLFGNTPINESEFSFINVLDKWGEERDGKFILGIFTDQHIFRLLGPSILYPFRNCNVDILDG